MKNLSVRSWNVQGTVNITGHTFFNKIRTHLINYSADVIALQEMSDATLKLKDIQDLGYNIFVPKNKNNHNVILSRYPILSSEEIIFPKWHQDVLLENCTRVDIQLDSQVLRVYNCHFGIFRVGIATRLKQLEHILSDSLKHDGPTIICGDMNTTIPKLGWNRKIISLWHQEPIHEMTVKGKFIDYDEREIFNQMANQYGFKEALNLYTPTWSPLKTELWETFQLKLDWFMVKRINIVDCKLGKYISDHKAIETQCELGS